jgi:hypothetical protein
MTKKLLMLLFLLLSNSLEKVYSVGFKDGAKKIARTDYARVKANYTYQK